MHITGCEHLFNICGKFALSGLDISPCVKFRTEAFSHITLRSQESGCNKAKLTGDHFLAALLFMGNKSAGIRVGGEVQFNSPDAGKSAFAVLDELLDGGAVTAWVAAENGDSFLLTVICLANSWVLRERVVLSTLVGKLRHHFKLNHRCTALTDCCTNAVVAGITAADYYHVPALGADEVTVSKSGVKQAFRGSFQVVNSEMYAACITSRRFYITGIRRTAGKYHRIETIKDILGGGIVTDVTASLELHALGFHKLHTAQNYRLIQLHIWYTVHEKSAGTV